MWVEIESGNLVNLDNAETITKGDGFRAGGKESTIWAVFNKNSVLLGEYEQNRAAEIFAKLKGNIMLGKNGATIFVMPEN